jgi:hypothetical protein
MKAILAMALMGFPAARSLIYNEFLSHGASFLATP